MKSYCAILFGLVALGCSQGEPPEATNLPAGAGKISNPSGELTPEQSQMAQGYKQTGNDMTQRMNEAARAEQEARKRTGGK